MRFRRLVALWAIQTKHDTFNHPHHVMLLNRQAGVNRTSANKQQLPVDLPCGRCSSCNTQSQFTEGQQSPQLPLAQPLLAAAGHTRTATAAAMVALVA